MLQSLHRRAASAQVSNAVEVELIGSEQASAYGHTVTSPTPLLTMARDLLEEEPGWFGHLPMLAYRGETLCLIARSVVEAARLRVKGDGRGFCALADTSHSPAGASKRVRPTTPTPQP